MHATYLFWSTTLHFRGRPRTSGRRPKPTFVSGEYETEGILGSTAAAAAESFTHTVMEPPMPVST